jgi:hypothetical protein
MDRITALRARRAGIIDQMEALLASVPEGEDMTADQIAGGVIAALAGAMVVAQILEDRARRRSRR